ncbi:MAG: hypothetical protein RIS54_1809 [Verrucomicrobiota bacterium]|jgi:hypothetical protein
MIFNWAKGWRLGVTIMAVLPVAAGAVERTLQVTAPAEVRVGEEVRIAVVAATDAGNGERIGFLQMEYRAEGTAWAALCYLNNIGPDLRREFRLPAERAGKIEVRVRVAFRDGLAGDVDFSGAAIRWPDTWEEWAEPPARRAEIVVRP